MASRLQLSSSVRWRHLSTIMTDHRGAGYNLARPIVFGAVAASLWFAIESILAPQPLPLPDYAVPILGAAGGAIWHLLERVPLRGRIWYFCRWSIVGSPVYLWGFFGGGPVSLADVLITLAFMIGSGIGLGYYAESFQRKDGDSAQ